MITIEVDASERQQSYSCNDKLYHQSKIHGVNFCFDFKQVGTARRYGLSYSIIIMQNHITKTPCIYTGKDSHKTEKNAAGFGKRFFLVFGFFPSFLFVVGLVGWWFCLLDWLVWFVFVRFLFGFFGLFCFGGLGLFIFLLCFDLVFKIKYNNCMHSRSMGCNCTIKHEKAH